MTDENTRLPSDSVVEAAAKAILAEEELSDFIRGIDNEWGAEPLPEPSALSWAKAFAKAALAAQPRDDVRELEHDAILAACHAYEQSTKPAPFNQMKDAIEAYRTALSQGDEQPDTDGLAALIRERVTDDLIEGVGFGTIQAQGKAMDLLSELRALAEGAGK